MWLMVLVAVARFWLGLCVMSTALALMRGGRSAGRLAWVPATTAFEAGTVSLVLALPTLACLLFLIVPGVIVALRWSQAILLVLDGQARWFDSAEESVTLTWGHRLDILLLWVILALVYLGVAGLAPYVPDAVDWALRAGTSAFSLTMLAAVYRQLIDE
jgi:hypothetical protein